MSLLRRQSRGHTAEGRPVPATSARSTGRRNSVTFGSILRLERSSVLLMIYLYCLAHFLIRVLVTPGYTIEEAEHILVSQSLQLGYSADKPPLLSWIYALAFWYPGVSTYLMFGIKYVLMGLGLSLYYLSARNMLTTPTASAMSLAGLGLLFTVGWGMHEDMLNAVGLLVCLSLSLHAMSRILTWRRPRDWAYLGVSIGLGLLTHHLYIIFPVALLVSTMFSGFFRESLKPLMVLLALGVAMVVYAPYGYWLATNPDRLADAYAIFDTQWSTDPIWIRGALFGAISLAQTLISATLPLGMFWATLFWTIWLPVLYPIFARCSTDEEAHEEAWRKILGRVFVIGALLLFTGILLGVQIYKNAWMLPVVFVLPMWMAAHVKRAGEFPIAGRAFTAIFLILTFGVMAGRLVEWRTEIEMCNPSGCRPYTPVQAWAEELEALGFSAGSIVAADPHLAGNLRGALPDARVLDASHPISAYPGTGEGSGTCLAVWRHLADMPAPLKDYLVIELKAQIQSEVPDGAIRRPFKRSIGKATTLYYQFVPSSSLCR